MQFNYSVRTCTHGVGKDVCMHVRMYVWYVQCTHLEEGLALSALVHEVLRVGLVLAVVKVHPKLHVLRNI